MLGERIQQAHMQFGKRERISRVKWPFGMDDNIKRGCKVLCDEQVHYSNFT